jgi:hypothetical protein
VCPWRLSIDLTEQALVQRNPQMATLVTPAPQV